MSAVEKRQQFIEKIKNFGISLRDLESLLVEKKQIDLAIEKERKLKFDAFISQIDALFRPEDYEDEFDAKEDQVGDILNRLVILLIPEIQKLSNDNPTMSAEALFDLLKSR